MSCPFYNGSLSMAEDSNTLYIQGARTTYQKVNGVFSQANFTLYINKGTLAATYKNVSSTAISSGYVKDSYNQIVRTDGQYVYTVDHGRSAPRAMVVFKRNNSGNVQWYRNVFEMGGNTSQTATYATLGDMQLSKNNILTIGTSVIQDSNPGSYKQRNVFISTVSKDNSDSTNLVWLTSYGESSKLTISNPYLVKATDNSFVAIWEEISSSTRNLKMVKIDENGNSFGSESLSEDSSEGLSDCAPVFKNGKIIWYTTGTRENISTKTMPKFYFLPAVFPPKQFKVAETTDTSVKLTWKFPTTAKYGKVYMSTDLYDNYSLVGTYRSPSCNVNNLEIGVNYFFKMICVDTYGVASDYSSVVSARPIPPAPYNVSATPESFTTVRLKWTAKTSVQFVEVWRTHKANAAQSEYVQLGVYNASDGTSLSRSLTPGKTYYYKLRGYSYNSSNKRVFSNYSTIVNATLKALTPYNVKATPKSTTTVKIEWTAPPDTQFVEVWRTHKANAEQKDYVQLGIYYASAGTSMSKSLTPGKTYYYKLRGYAYNKDNKREYSPYSNIVSATPPLK